MKALKFNPQVYRIVTNGINQTTWDLLTVDGESPRETVYFMINGDSPSSNDSDQIQAAIEDEDWEVLDIDDTDNEIEDWDINIDIFPLSEEYREIRNSLTNP
jgi:FlaG/FlaF family flagellin (archaellin)